MIAPSRDSHRESPITIRKYTNRRLYNMADSRYVTLTDLTEMVKRGVEFQVEDSKSGEDITRTVLTQIILEQESKGHHLLPISFLRQLIGYYGDSMQWLVPQFLDSSFTAFTRNQEQIRGYLRRAAKGWFDFGDLQRLGAHQMMVIEQVLAGGAHPPSANEPASPADPPQESPQPPANPLSRSPDSDSPTQRNDDSGKAQRSELETLKARLEVLERELAKASAVPSSTDSATK